MDIKSSELFAIVAARTTAFLLSVGNQCDLQITRTLHHALGHSVSAEIQHSPFCVDIHRCLPGCSDKARRIPNCRSVQSLFR